MSVLELCDVTKVYGSGTDAGLASLADRVVFIHDGRLRATDPTERTHSCG